LALRGLHTAGRGRRVQERLAALRRDSAAAEVAECTFAPAIDGRSKSLMAQRTQALQARPCPPAAAGPRL